MADFVIQLAEKKLHGRRVPCVLTTWSNSYGSR